MKRRSRKVRRRRGFTIVEVMVVVLIIGIIASLAVTGMMSRVGRSKRTITKARISQIEAQVELFYGDYERYPQTLDELIFRPPDIDEERWSEPAMTPKNLLDPWGRPFEYEYPGQMGGRYDLYSVGPDGEPGGEGDAADIGNWD